MKLRLKPPGMVLFAWLSALLWPAFTFAQSNLAFLVSAPGDYIGQGQTQYTTNQAQIGAFKTSTGVQLTAFGYIILLTGPGQAELTVHNYTNAITYPGSPSEPGIRIFGNGRGCSPVCGEFQVFELEADVSGQMVHFWATFTQRYPCSGPPLTGEIRYNSRLAPTTPLPRTLRVPTDFSTIQAALDSTFALALDRVLVEPGLYNESVQFGAKRAQLISTAGPWATYILPPAGTAAVEFSGATADALLCGFTLMDGTVGISIGRGGSPTILSNAIVNCGSGISCDSGSIDLRGSPTIRSNSIVGCAGTAIGLWFTGSPLVEGNRLEDNGGGITMWEAGSPLIRNNIIQRNHGDGINLVNDSDADIVQNLILDNDGDGIGWLVPSGARGPYVVNNTILSNGGAAIAADGFDAGAQIIGNILEGSPALWIGSCNDSALPLTQFNDVYSPSGLAYAGAVGDLTGVDGNISANPFFACQPGTDFHLLPGSPCIDAGTNGAPMLPETDFDGGPRIRPGRGASPAVVDMGAFEFNPAAPPEPCLFLTCPGTVVVITAPGAVSATASFPSPLATPGAAITVTPPSGSVFPAGTNTVLCQAQYGTNRLSCTFSVVVLQPPFLTRQPQSLTVAAGTPAQFSVAAQGTSPLSYQWLFEQRPLPATNASLTVTNPQANDEGVYRVILTNFAGSVTSAPALLRVAPAAPSILEAPVSVAVRAGSNATLNVVASGSEPLSYQWFRGVTAVAEGRSRTLIITDAQAGDAADYHVVVSSALGLATSSPATLSVQAAAPVFVLQPGLSLALVAGATGTLTAQARGTEVIRYQWRRGSVPLAGSTQSTLTFSNASPDLAGSYDVVASNALGVATSRLAYVWVSGAAPAFTRQPPASVEVLAGTTLTLDSQASGTAPLQYQWFFQGTNLPSQTSRQLVIRPVSAGAAGVYFVVASNRIGMATSTVAQVTVNQSLAIAQALTNQIVDRGQTVALAVGVAATGSVTYAWQFNGWPVPGTEPVLLLTNVQPSQSGFYTVTIGNALGSLASTARLTVFGPVCQVQAWGDNASGQTNAPALDDLVAVAGGSFHSVALRRSGSLAGWGYDADARLGWETNGTRFVGLAAGANHTVAITEDGTVRAWGKNDSGQTDVPPLAPSALAVAAGGTFSLALLGSGQVVGWGDNTYGQLRLPWAANGFRAIAAGHSHSLGLTRDGAVLGCGLNTCGQASPAADLTGVMAIAAGYLHSVALRSNGTVVVWGDNTFGQTDIPLGLSNVVAIAAGDLHTLALLADGSVVGWGDNTFGQVRVAAGLHGAIAIAAGADHSMALVPIQPFLRPRLDPTGLVLEWNGSGVLQWAPTPLGPFTDMPEACPPFTNDYRITPAQFFRLRR